MTHKVSFAAMAAMVAILGLAAPALASSAQAPRAAVTRTVVGLANRPRVLCTENVYDFYNVPSAYAYAGWSANSCTWQIRSKIHCVNAKVGLKTTAYGGWVKSVNLDSQANCPSGYPTLTNAWYQYRVASGDPITTVQFFP